MIECVARLVRGRSVKPFNHQVGSNPIALTKSFKTNTNTKEVSI